MDGWIDRYISISILSLCTLCLFMSFSLQLHVPHRGLMVPWTVSLTPHGYHGKWIRVQSLTRCWLLGTTVKIPRVPVQTPPVMCLTWVVERATPSKSLLQTLPAWAHPATAFSWRQASTPESFSPLIWDPGSLSLNVCYLSLQHLVPCHPSWWWLNAKVLLSWYNGRGHAEEIPSTLSQQRIKTVPSFPAIAPPLPATLPMCSAAKSTPSLWLLRPTNAAAFAAHPTRSEPVQPSILLYLPSKTMSLKSKPLVINSCSLANCVVCPNS